MYIAIEEKMTVHHIGSSHVNLINFLQIQYIQAHATKENPWKRLRWSGLRADQVYETRPYLSSCDRRVPYKFMS